MRKMYSDKQIADKSVLAVKKAINDGEIDVGGVPLIEAGDAGKALIVNQAETGAEWAEVSAPDNVLVLPESAPAAQQLVGINTSGEQNAISIGSGLEIVNNSLTAASEIIKLDFGGTNTLNISDELYTKLTTSPGNNILFIYNAAYSAILDPLGIYLYSTYASKYELVSPTNYQSTDYNIPTLPPIKAQTLRCVRISFSGTEGSRSMSVASVTNANKYLTGMSVNDSYIYLFDNTSGTKSMGNIYAPEWYSLAYQAGTTGNYKYIKLNLIYIDQATKKLYAEGKDDANKYTLEWSKSNGAYTITTTSL